MSQRRGVMVEIDSAVEEISLACVAIQALLAHHSVARLLRYELVLAVDEILNNIIEHDLGFRTGTRIGVHLEIGVSAVEIRIAYFSDRELAPWPREGAIPDAKLLPERGFGCFLVNRVIDRVIYRRLRKRNLFILHKQLPQPTRRKSARRAKSTSKS